ncbi:hypothetical protein ASE48_10165 [Mycobacterium sp. Root265]|uniref:hypothetical protein n=1 Tax=Mycobacterium sp. Root265 TaxID=1736504 RepID=UPI00070D3C4B|nr:hypothetical protein [Mycobacterium sp. Root265]KRD07792.1 hypothetical protein ASE48_10165 [Mycobacterium sp. Root265]
MSAADIDTAFTEAIAGWDDKIQCDLAKALGRPCKRAATWLVRQHGCADFLMCTQHYNAHFLRLAEESLAAHGSARCRFCKRKFAAVGAIFTAVRL